MLESFYNNFGFVGSLVLALLIFLFFIFWMGGVAGLCREHDSQKDSIFRLVLAVLIPIYPVVWLILDMISQKKQLRRL